MLVGEQGPRARIKRKELLAQERKKEIDEVSTPKISKFVKRVVSAQGQEKKIVGTKIEDLDLASQSGFIVVDRDEEGELITFEMEVESSNISLEIQFKGDAGTRLTFCDDTMTQLLRKGRGLTPGDVEAVSSDRAKDPTGTPLNNLVYLGRYKDEEFSDYIQDSRRTLVARFDPVNPWSYSGITIKIKNYNLLETGIKRVRSILLVRYVYGDFEEVQGQELHPEDLAIPTEEDPGFSPIDLQEEEMEQDVEESQEEDIEFNTTGIQKIKEMEEEEEGPPVTDDRPEFMRS